MKKGIFVFETVAILVFLTVAQFMIASSNIEKKQAEQQAQQQHYFK